MSDNGVLEQSFDATIDRIWGHLDAPPAEACCPKPVASRKIAIVGRAPDTMMKAPFDDPSWEIWSLSNAASVGQIKRWDVWFELHDLDEGFNRWQPEYKQWLGTDHGKPVYIARPHEHMPHARIYPREQVMKLFGNYFNNSVSWMLAAAILEGATDLALYGVNMAQSDPVMHQGNAEYQHQRPSCEFMLGVARGRGINITIPEESDLLKCARLYGFESDVGMVARKVAVRMAELHERRKQAQQQQKAHEQEAQKHLEQARHWELTVCKFDGALEDCDFFKNRLQA